MDHFFKYIQGKYTAQLYKERKNLFINADELMNSRYSKN